MSAVHITLSQEDLKRINNVDEYRRTQTIMRNMEAYKHLEVGTAVKIKHKGSDSFLAGNSWYNRSNKPPNKYLIVENDNGFVFVKRILASGKPGKLISCLTTEYGIDNFDIVLDDEYADALLLDEEYDPTAAAKEHKKKKGKASRYNDKFRIRYKDPMEAYKFLKTVKTGDVLWEAGTTFGDGVDKCVVIKVDFFKIEPQKSTYSYRRDHIHEKHAEEGFTIGIKVELKTEGGYTRNIHFYNICNSENHSRSCGIWYSKKPLGPEDMTI